MGAGVVLEKHATGHEMSKSRASHTQRKTGLHSEDWWLPKLCSFTFLCAQSLCRSSFRRWQLETSCLAQPPLLYRSGLKWAEFQARGRTVVALCFCNWNSGTIASGKTRAALKTSKFTTAWWLASNLKKMLLAIKCHINNQKSRVSHTQRKTGLHSQDWW